MRTTVDLPPRTHERARALARERGISVSAMVAELTARGLAQFDEPLTVLRDELTGLPVISLGRRITSEQVANLLDDDA
ncbi:MAG: hypothetical protein JST33_05160 [Actinobacteria bacterium]|nr:hypothetical protein [Actinomycetota bacterium]